jgi:hypothetical protein
MLILSPKDFAIKSEAPKDGLSFEFLDLCIWAKAV